MFTIFIWVIICLTQVYANIHLSEDRDQNIVSNLSISAFLDDSRYIRLNFTWENSSDKVDTMSIRFIDNDDNCNPIDEVDHIQVKETPFLIIPPLNLANPADFLKNGCKYEIILESSSLEQSLNYSIPDCVEDKCICGAPKDSPYQISSISPIHDDVFFLKWNKTSNITLKVLDITYIRENNSSSRTHIKDKNVTDEGVEILLNDLKEKVSYKITVRFSFDGCIYASWINISVPEKKQGLSNILGLGLGLVLSMLCVSILLFITGMLSRQIRSLLKKYIICWNDEASEDVIDSTPLSFSPLKEEVNVLYVPENFLMNSHKFDKYEIPRNKVIIKKELGKGAFGVVYSGEVFELGKTKGFTEVAVKQLRSGAPDEEMQDLRNEINILKKVGEHKNIVKLLACVTMDQPNMIILELVPCGSLKNYLKILRNEWLHRKSRFFFEDDVLEDNQPNSLNRNSDDSYIQPNKYSEEQNCCKSKPTGGSEYISKYLTLNQIRQVSEKSEGPQSPVSFTSSGLPSIADTEITLLSSEPSSPISNNYSGTKIHAVLDNTELQNFALQIAKGMEYLEDIKVTHRDLAARNILMTNDKVLKISDFGLSRIGTYVSSIGKKLPLRWMSIEAIEEKTCDNKSDVWSFAVVLWEICTLGAFPYQKTPNNQVLYDLKIGKRLERPRICSDELYDLMLNCWNEKPQNRPMFCEIVSKLEEGEQKKPYVDFSALNPSYVFPPITEDCS